MKNNPPKSKIESTAEMTRRRFLGTSLGAAGIAGFPTIIPASALGKDGKAAPSERVTIGLIGCGNRAGSARTYLGVPDAEIVALADPFGRRIAAWKKRASKKGKNFKEYKDFREMLAGDVDAVHITTGDHWHVPSLLLSARAGKHVYVEKPLGVSIEQCLACREITNEKKDLKIQYGTQNRSTVYVRGSMEVILNGHIGEVKDIYVWAPKGASGGKSAEEPVPDDLDYEMWLGPAAPAPFCHDRAVQQGARNGIFHIYDYAIGFLAGWGAHPMDQFQWWLDETGAGMPEQVQATGTIPTEGLFNTATHWDALLKYPGGREVRFSDHESIAKHLPKLEGFKAAGHGTLFVGSEGWIYCHRGGFKASSKELLMKHRDPGERKVVNAGKSHFHNFVDAVLGRNKTVSPLDSAIRSDITCHLTDLAIRHGGTVAWDAKEHTITGNEAAKKALHRPMRKPWDVLNPKYT